MTSDRLPSTVAWTDLPARILDNWNDNLPDWLPTSLKEAVEHLEMERVGRDISQSYGRS